MLMLMMLVILEIIPVVVGYTIFKLTETGRFDGEEVRYSNVDAGDKIVYTKTKISPFPGAKAYNVTAADKGENYTYLVDKYWVVEDVFADGRVMARTRRGKRNYVWLDDPNLRKAGVIESLIHRDWFPDLAKAA